MRKESKPWGSLGPINLVSPIVPTSYDLKRGYGFNEMDRISGKPSLQQIPDALITISMAFKVHYLEGNQSPAEYLQEFVDMASAKEAIALVVHTERIGLFVIDSLDVTHQYFSQDGRLLDVEWNLSLLEWSDRKPKRRKASRGFLKRVRTA